MDELKIGQAAKLAGISIETIRFYERQGLLEKPPRSQAGYRCYSAKTLARIKFIKRAKELGFSLKEISELLSLRVDPDTTCAMVKSRATVKISDIESKIETLQNMKRALVKLTKSCRGDGPTSKCPILDFLESQAD
ncbi:MAG: heavy metal-responsive transcriptional regulator [Sedimentisphaerales bacterium]|nr:heavy metal-responsive transcriptional regulator [Sedimentisphaerales bacterium]